MGNGSSPKSRGGTSWQRAGRVFLFLTWSNMHGFGTKLFAVTPKWWRGLDQLHGLARMGSLESTVRQTFCNELLHRNQSRISAGDL